MELNFWTGTEFEGGSYDEKRRPLDGDAAPRRRHQRTMHPRHVVLATGVSGIPSVPEIAGLKDFAGTVMHSSQYEDGENWKGKRAIVIGTGNSGHDIAQDLHSSGARSRCSSVRRRWSPISSRRRNSPTRPTTRARWRTTT